ncbi:uncharacterized protein Z520_03554 [Fonsecaea multimorphosa CBS 102226]|uniref:Nephrocystin 3-like N-terminal domain-containing protein n=1 Tax=Fonsecaea multimorphosa CBS 102226 TaxID=1442371 RepID=A0A0D2K534_9EURO|nr:uncharacterized protein Z520_03554 [Fonsecaea multimorphosa CBS 102226]KIY00888.1 hypothetical protein Z520_03554 [Fonsecaea multimorphosa CBS 102226]
MLHAPDSTEGVVDVVAVHGLSPQASSWLSLSLPRHLPEARIFSYGYDFELRDIDLVNKKARHLLEAISQARSADNTSDRPVVFIAHSLGGLVVKQALICSQALSDDPVFPKWQARNLTRHTRGIVFVGTPHCVNGRTDRAIWKFLQLCDSSAAMDTLKKRLHEILPPLQLITAKFKDFISAEPRQIKLISFFEEPTTLEPDDNMPGLFDPSMAHIVMKEDSVLEGFDSVPIRGDHLVHNAEALFQLEDGRQRIASPANGTFSWFCKNSVFERWAQNGHRGILWINGKLGSGKSTLMKYILDHGNYPVAAKISVLTLSYFFDPFRGDTKPSASDFYRALLHQLWKQARHLPCEHDILDSTELHFTSQLRGNWMNKPSVLAEQLNRLLFDISEHHPIYIFIDALDECATDEVVSILEFLRQALVRAPPSHLRICVSSRDTLWFVGEDVRVFVDQENKEDIVSFTETQIKIRAAKYGDSLLPFKDEFLNIILEKAAGIFLWVPLALHIVYNETTDSADTIRVLRSLPTDLTKVYQRILGNILEEKPQIQLQISQILSWVLFASRPLTVQELAAALSFVNIDRSQLHAIQERSLDAEYVYFNAIPSLASTLIDRTWGLVKIVYSKYDYISETWSTKNHSMVHLLHSSVKDFLTTSSFLTKHSGQKTVVEAAAAQNLDIARVCLEYCAWSTEAFEHGDVDEQNLDATLSFLDYSSTFWLKHLQIANMGATSEELWAQKFPLPSKKLLLSWTPALVLVGKEARFYQSSSVLHVASYYNLSWWVRTWAHQEIMLKSRRSKQRNQEYPKEGALPRIDSITEPSDLKQLLDQTDAEGRTPLLLACETGSLEICKLLIHYGADLNSVDPKYKYSPLMWAVAAGDEPTTRLLLDAGADVNDHRSGTSPLCLAATTGNLAVVRILLEYGANVRYECPAIQEHSAPIRSRDGRDVDSKLPIPGRLMPFAGHFNLSPLHYAILAADLSTTRLLLMKGAEAVFGGADGLSQHRSLWLDRIILSMRQDALLVDCTTSQPCPEPNGGGSNSARRKSSHPARDSHADSPVKRRQVPDGFPNDNDNDDDDDDDDLGRRPPRKRPNLSSRDDTPANKKPLLTYACPYFKYAPHRYGCQRACSAHGWPNMNRLKQHLHQKHYIHLCDRCGTKFEHNEQKQEHRISQEGCPYVPTEQRQRDFADGFDDHQQTKLRDKTMKKNQANNNEKTYWEEVYKTCFPDAIDSEIPSPYFEEAADARYNMFLTDRLRRSPSALSLITGHVGREVAAQVLNEIADYVTEVHTQFQTAGGSGIQLQQGAFLEIENAPRPPPILPSQPAQYQASPGFHTILPGIPVDMNFADDSGVYSQDQEWYTLGPVPEKQPDARMPLLDPTEVPLPQFSNTGQSPWSYDGLQTSTLQLGFGNRDTIRYSHGLNSPRVNEGGAHGLYSMSYQYRQSYQQAAINNTHNLNDQPYQRAARNNIQNPTHQQRHPPPS